MLYTVSLQCTPQSTRLVNSGATSQPSSAGIFQWSMRMTTSSNLAASAISPNNKSLNWIRPQLFVQIKSTFTKAELNQLGQPLITNETQTGKTKALETLAADSVVAKETSLGPDHEDTLGAMHTLGLVQSEVGSPARAEQTWRKMLTIRERDSPYSALAVRSNLGFVLVEQGKYQEAEEIARQLLPALQKRYGKESPQALGTLRQLIEAVGGQRRVEDAKSLVEEGFVLVGGMGGGKFTEYQQEELEALQQVAARLGE